jgi:hypothetical protein
VSEHRSDEVARSGAIGGLSYLTATMSL